jgi:ATP-dependent RNA helicase DDX27
MKPTSAGWSYSQVLKKLEQQNTSSSSSAVPPRIDVASLIAAKRQTFANNSNKSLESKPPMENQEEGNESLEGEEGGARSDGSSSESGSSSEDDQSVDRDNYNDINIEGSLHELEEDVLKFRAGGYGGADGVGGSTRPEKDKDDSASSSCDLDDDDDEQEASKAAAFFDQQSTDNGTGSIEVFSQLTLSRPLLRGVAAMGFVKPTPIQATVIPLALAGRDICASAVTGSGKTAAFLLPLLERLLHRLHGSIIKAVVLAPTRELAAQCMAFATTLAQYSKLRACLIVGGSKNGPAQQAELRARPDLVIATRTSFSSVVVL